MAEKQRRAQDAARAAVKRRRGNVEGTSTAVKVTLSESEKAELAAAAAEAGSTVPRYLLECALTPASRPVGAGETDEGESVGPWLPWPKRRALATALMSATGAVDEVRLEQLAKIGGNLNQIAHAVNLTGVAAEDLGETLAELREVMAELTARAVRLEDLARQVVRR